MTTIQIGKIRRPGAFGGILPQQPFSLPWEVARRHVRAAASTPADDGLVAVALHMAHDVLKMGGRVIVIDGLGKQKSAAGRLQSEFSRVFSNLMKWESKEDLEILPEFLDGEAAGAVAYLSGEVTVEPSGGHVCAAMDALRTHAVSKLSHPIGDAEQGEAVEADWEEYLPVLVVLRGVKVHNLWVTLRAANMAVLHLGDGLHDDPLALQTSFTSIRIVPLLGVQEHFTALVEVGAYLTPKIYQNVEIDASILSLPLPPLCLELGHVVRPGMLGRFRKKQPYRMPWSVAREHIRVMCEMCHDSPIMGLSLIMVRQVLEHGGRVVIVDPISANSDVPFVRDFDAQFFTVFPGMREVRKVEDLYHLAALMDEDVPASGDAAIMLISGEAAKAQTRQEGDYGKVAINPALQTISMCAFVKQLRSSSPQPGSPDDFVPVLLIVRNTSLATLDCGIDVADLGLANIAVMQLDCGEMVPPENKAFAQTFLTIKSDGNFRRVQVRSGRDETPTHFLYPLRSALRPSELKAAREQKEQELVAAGVYRAPAQPEGAVE